MKGKILWVNKRRPESGRDEPKCRRLSIQLLLNLPP